MSLPPDRSSLRRRRVELVCERNCLDYSEAISSSGARVLLAHPTDPNDEWAWDAIWDGVLDGFRADEIQQEINRIDGFHGGIV